MECHEIKEQDNVEKSCFVAFLLSLGIKKQVFWVRRIKRGGVTAYFFYALLISFTA
jgi:hypothetical protein